MIDELHVTNVALIEQAEVQFSGAMTVLTGETGAGKTALLSALKLIMGERADSSAVREGHSSLEVQARLFGVTHVSAREDLRDLDEDGSQNVDLNDDEVASTDDEIVVIRKVGADGRSRVSLNGSLSSVSELACCVRNHIDLCGQHEHQRLLKPAFHARMLDAWIGDEAKSAQEAYRKAYAAYQEACAACERIKNLAQQGSAQVDDARITLRRINEVNPREHEYEELEAELPKLEHGEVLAQAAHRAYEALRDEGCALDGVSEAYAALDDVVSYDESLSGYLSSLEDVRIILEDCARDLRGYRDSVEFDEEALEQMRQRFHDLNGLLRAYGPRMEDVFAARTHAADLVEAVDDSEDRIKRAEQACEQTKGVLLKEGERFFEVRKRAKDGFTAAVNEVLSELEMHGAYLDISLELKPFESWNTAESSAVEFLFAPGPKMTPRPLAKIASGGEASRVTLAIKAVMGSADEVQTLVFDEIDAGVGGQTAHAVAQVLSRLAKTHQVIVVTHLAQLAVCGDMHYTVSKHLNDSGENVTEITRVEGDDRVFEIARMLSGDTSEASVNHARELLGAVRVSTS